MSTQLRLERAAQWEAARATTQPRLPLGARRARSGSGNLAHVSLPGTARLRRDFNDERAERRVLSLVSPTCDQCAAGLRLVLDGVAGADGAAAFVLWLNMLEGDTAQAAGRAAISFGVDGVRAVQHYWEDDGWPVSSRVRSLLGIGPYDPTQSAWDVHLLYRLGAEWNGNAPPLPAAWAHNLLDDLCVGERLSATVVRSWLAE
jgi:hypothetical protein